MCSNGFRILVMFLFTAISFVLNSFMPDIPVVFWYIISINIFSFILFGIDKLNATKDKKRVSKFTFYYLSFIGGVLGIFLGIFIFRHKLKSKTFLTIESVIFIIWLIFSYLFIKNLDTIVNSIK